MDGAGPPRATTSRGDQGKGKHSRGGGHVWSHFELRSAKTGNRTNKQRRTRGEARFSKRQGGPVTCQTKGLKVSTRTPDGLGKEGQAKKDPSRSGQGQGRGGKPGVGKKGESWRLRELSRTHPEGQGGDSPRVSKRERLSVIKKIGIIPRASDHVLGNFFKIP